MWKENAARKTGKGNEINNPGEEKVASVTPLSEIPTERSWWARVSRDS